MLDSKHMIVVNEDGQETEVDILLTFDSPDGTKKFVLISDPKDPEENVYAFLYNDEGGMEEVTDPDDFKMCQEVLSAFMDEEDADEA
ncbi:MAG: DUF1292 domain-containing protein [Solobacterium sp.]|nr:DUF1292 domain-containing protein [Solobacterium sp.]MBQ9824455.1 DUF1292 domain-containing protein [Solobacterium sp.]